MSLLKDNKFVRAKLAKARSYLAIASRIFRVLASGMEMIVAASPRAAAGNVALVAVASLLPIGQVWLAKLVVDHLAGRRRRTAGYRHRCQLGHRLRISPNRA